jgi:hypothetical protein
MNDMIRFSSLLALLLSAIPLLGQGNISIVQPAPTRITDTETGQPVGSGYLAAIYWAPLSVANADDFVQLGAARTVLNGNFPFTGNFTLPTASPGETVRLYGAAWEAAYGSTYNQAAQVTGAKVGRSTIIQTPTGVSPNSVAVTIPNFSVSPVPEPSTLAFVAFGVCVLLTLRHRKQ